MRITATFAGLGAAVGGVLFLVLRFVVGPTVVEGLGTHGHAGLARRFADYLPTDDASSVPLRLLPVALGTGLVAGLLIGVVARVVASRVVGSRVVAARWRADRGSVAAALVVGGPVVAGLVVGVLLAVELRAYGYHSPPGGDIGWYAYSPLQHGLVVGSDGILYGGGPGPASPWPLVVTGAVVGLAVGIVAAAATWWTGRVRRA